ncbi:Homoaconitase, mitochondrial [Metarhizium guizhouense ARSEF 977]|uniref:Homoaconitase, mitochondrial n=1 Tax=Metarhizium guizhouense (strain ARSEF 977) TaxID=1276136 RepID=A0A0B4GFM2_METGA|nr:Homoaconitase, mitochondrial [Metarhizium guizhouense ARSEF 977]
MDNVSESNLRSGAGRGIGHQIMLEEAFAWPGTIAAAKVFKEAAKSNSGNIPRIADGVQLYIAAASASEQEAAEATGDWQVLVNAGAQPMPSGCAQCIGFEAGEVGISASNRNFVGRLGSRDSLPYLASPEVVAASAISEYGFGTGMESTTESEISNMVQQLDSLVQRVESIEVASKLSTEILPGFPEKISGEILFYNHDNISTDGIYPGSLTYQDNVSKQTMARACMQNYDPEFDSIAKPNDILVAGFNFGHGSSREQAATAPLAKQIPLVVAGSLGNIFAKNSPNNALVALEVPRLVELLRACFPSNAMEQRPTRRTGWTLTWDVRRRLLKVQEGSGGET